MCVLAFPAAWMLALLVCICFAATCRWAACAAVALALAVAWPMAKVTFALEHISRQQQSDSSFTVKVMSYNVHGFNAEDHRVKNRPNITMEAVEALEACTQELRRSIEAGGDGAGALGETLFAAADTARLLAVDPEDALNEALERFIRRFDKIERDAADRGKTTNELSPDELAACWQNKER